jgi:hypothetical protein
LPCIERRRSVSDDAIYKMNAARPAAAAIPANAVWRAPPAEELEEEPPVAEVPAVEALETREERDD